MFSPDTVLAAAAAAAAVTSAAFYWSAARSIRRAADAYTARLLHLARMEAKATRPDPPLPPRRPDWARDTTLAMPLVPTPPGGLRGPTRPKED